MQRTFKIDIGLWLLEILPWQLGERMKFATEVAVKKLAVLIFLGILAGLGMPGRGFAQAPFYQGKTINVVYGGGPGGTVDLRFRATASILRKHIPGRPTFVIEYMPGGGSRKAGNYIYRARPDGLTMGVMLSSFVPAAVLGLSGVLYDIDKLHYLGSPTSGEPYIFLSRKEARLDNIEKLRSAPGVRIGAQSVGHNLYNIGRILAYVLGMKEPKFITGFAQGTEVNLAMMQGELDARWTIQATLVREAPEWIEKKLVDFHVVNEVPKGRRHPHPVFAQLPDIERFTKAEKERKLLAMQRAFVSAGTPFMFPPGTPADKVQILRDAMRKTFADPEFFAEFRKLVGEEPTPLPPEGLEKAIRELPRDREIVELFNKLSSADPLPQP
jgi:tripartite-type tricarboxylate transporter receptor subunit TctC